jgi:hypothetical protein
MGVLVPQASEDQRPALFAGRDRVFLAIVSAAGFVLGLVGIYHYGYNAQDFVTHRDQILTYPRTFTYSINYSAGLAWLGSFVRVHVSASHYLEAIALVFLVLNAAALWILYAFLWLSLSWWQLRYASAAFVTFVPFRVTTAVALASDAFTLPLFAAAAACVLRLCEEPRRPGTWAALGLVLVGGTLCKYSLIGLVPPIGLLLLVAIGRRLPKGGRLPWVLAAVLTLALPALVLEFQLRESMKAHGYLSGAEWTPKDAPPVMRWSDLLMLQRSDARLLSAPDYFHGKLYEPRAYSYPGLLLVSSFSDVLGNFQPPLPPVTTAWDHRTQDYVMRERSARSQALQEVSVWAGLVYSALALVGVAVCLALSVLSLTSGRPRIADAVVVLTLLALGYYAPLFYSLHRLGHPYSEGYWLPRLIIPSLLVFFILGFVALDQAAKLLERRNRHPGPLLGAFAGFTFAACLVFVGFLV